MSRTEYRYIYGPVSSWRLGRSLGVDPVGGRTKHCNYDCVYCQIGKTRTPVTKRKVFVTKKGLDRELSVLPPMDLDYITFSGMGEPTLAENLGELILAVRALRKEPVAVLTNASLMHLKDVREALSMADFVAAKLDVSRQEDFREVNRPARGITLDRVIRSLTGFSRGFCGKFALQIMFMESNEKSAKDIARLARQIAPDEVQINTPLRPCGVKPLSRDRIEKIERSFEGLNTVSVYKGYRKKVRSISPRETLKRRGKS